MADLLAGLIAIIIEALSRFFASKMFAKVVLAAFVYVFLFTIIPLLIQFLVPQPIMDGLKNYFQMLQGGGASLACSGTKTIASSGNSGVVSCNTVVTLVQFGQGVAYILNWIQFPALLACMLPAMAVSFLFKRI